MSNQEKAVRLFQKFHQTYMEVVHLVEMIHHSQLILFVLLAPSEPSYHNHLFVWFIKEPWEYLSEVVEKKGTCKGTPYCKSKKKKKVLHNV